MKKYGIILTLSLVIVLLGCTRRPRTTEKKPTTERTVTTKDKVTSGNISTHEQIEYKTFYVSPTGEKDNDGLSVTTPTTLEHALELMGSGDTINMLEGLYEYSDKITISNSGSEIKRNVINCENGVVIDFSTTKTDDKTNNGGINISGSYWEVNNMNVINSDYYGFIVSGRGNRINNCKTSENNFGGFNINSSLSTYTNCLSEKNSLVGYFAYGFYIYGSGDNNTFDSCVSTDNQDSGFYITCSKKVTFKKCLAINNGLTGDAASSQRSGFVFNNKGHEFDSCIAYNNALNGFLVPTAYAEKGSFTIKYCSSINNHSKNYYLKTNNNDIIIMEYSLSYNNYDGNGDSVIDASNDYIIGSVKNSIIFYSKAYYFELENNSYNSLDISKTPLDLSDYTNPFTINLTIPEEMKEYLDLDEKAARDVEAEATSSEPDYTGLEYNIIYYKDGHINLYDYLDRSLLFQEELFGKLGIVNNPYFGSDINKIEE